MIDVIVHKPSPYGLEFIHDKPLGFIIYHIKHDRVNVSYSHASRFLIEIVQNFSLFNHVRGPNLEIFVYQN